MSGRTASRKRMDSLQALRALAFIGIFLEHADAPLRWPHLGVGVFFVMSGFLMVYNHYDDVLDTSLKGSFRFSIKRIAKLYPLHILTMLLATIRYILFLKIRGEFTSKSVVHILKSMVLHITLLQDWFQMTPNLNGVAWFLSATMFLYFMFPFMHGFIKRTSRKTLWMICGMILLAEWAICIPMISRLGFDNTVYKWAIYYSPVSRLGDFFVGACLGKYYAEEQPIRYAYRKASVFECTALIATIIIYILFNKNHTSLLVQALLNPTTIFIPLATAWIFLFACNAGVITKLLTNKYLISLGNISAYAFLIHTVVTVYVRGIFVGLGKRVNMFPMYIQLAVIVVEFVLTILFSVLYRDIHRKYTDRRKALSGLN